MVEPWSTVAEPPLLGHAEGVVTLVEGHSFLVCGRSGSIHPGSPHGLFVLDTRYLSTLHLTIDGQELEPLDVIVDEPFHAVFVGRVRPQGGRADTHLAVVRRRAIGRGLREDLQLRNFGTEPVSCLVALSLDVDFADLFEVKDSRVRRLGEYSQAVDGGTFRFTVQRGDTARHTLVRFDRAPLSGPQEAVWEARIEPQGTWELCTEVVVGVDGADIAPKHRCGEPIEHTEPRVRLDRWRTQVPVVTSGHLPLVLAAKRATDDLGVLQMPAPSEPDQTVIAAGAPWFMTLFGRDSLLTAWMALLVDPQLALGVLRTLARHQGREVVEGTEEQPGRILHEVRFGDAFGLTDGAGSIYYGTADATPLFVMLLGELRRWGLADAEVDALLPHADRALEWITSFGDADGDGYVEYERMSPQGLLHQGWKDSWDGVRFHDGRQATPPIALCEVQAYTYAAYIARAHFAEQAGDRQTARGWLDRARDLKQRFNADFWVDERRGFAIGLDADKRPIDTLTSNMGHCLWTGIVDEDKARAVADHLLSPALWTGWGIRTLASTSRAYNPISYHCGSVWPHDTALCVAGLMRYGFVEEAQRVALGLLDAAHTTGGRFPELFCGFDRADLAAPVGYPTSCSPQAWAAAAPLLLVRTLLRLDPWIPHGELWLAPALPEAIGNLRVAGIPLANGRVTVTVDSGEVTVEGLPEGIRWRREPRRPLTGLHEELS